jgi:hypothetical protein
VTRVHPTGAIALAEEIAMAWLSRVLGYVPASERKGIDLGDTPAWEISPPRDAADFLRAISLLAPPESVLYLEGGSPPAEVRAYLANNAATRITKVTMGTIWPRPETFHVSISPRSLEGLAQLADRHALPEIAIHLHVYKGTEVLLQWYDAGDDDPLLVSKQIPEETVREFCRRLGVTYRDAADRV